MRERGESTGARGREGRRVPVGMQRRTDRRGETRQHKLKG